MIYDNIEYIYSFVSEQINPFSTSRLTPIAPLGVGRVIKALCTKFSEHAFHGRIYVLGLKRQNKVLIKNQYSVGFIEDFIEKTLFNILDKKNEDSAENLSLDEKVDPNACVHMIDDRDKFLFFINYWGKPTDHFVQSLRM